MRTRLTVTVAAIACAVTALGASAASADIGEGRGGSNDGGQFSAWAYYGSATGGGNVAIAETCTLTMQPDAPAHIEYNVISYDDGATYTVWKDCVLDGENVDDRSGQFPPGDQWDILDSWVVTPADPEEMINEAIARLNPVPPTIITNPGAAGPGMVGIPTYLSFETAIAPQTAVVEDGPIRVEIVATPTGEITWDTGDGLPACNAPAGPAGECAHVYDQSSIDGDATHHGLPAYTISAEVNYTGAYTVSANGVQVGGATDIGDIQRTSETALAVNEAQAINNGAGG
ncbi:MAG TPA: hypothetical protein VFY82_12565 [Acidimicrobiales bacterium]|nr:hypothetical protein [Acidimicrobiales bacterium]